MPDVSEKKTDLNQRARERAKQLHSISQTDWVSSNTRDSSWRDAQLLRDLADENERLNQQVEKWKELAHAWRFPQ